MNKFSNFAATIDDLASLDFVDGGYCVPEHEVDSVMPERLRAIFPPPYYEWWNARQEKNDEIIYDHIDVSLAKIATHLKDNGPYDGFFGFSQGGSLAHLLSLLTLRAPDLLDPAIPPPRFGVFLSARTTRHAAHAKLLAGAVSAPLPLPSLVIYGGKDADVAPELTRELMTTLDSDMTTEIFMPEGKHKIPKLNAEERATVREFLMRQQ